MPLLKALAAAALVLLLPSSAWAQFASVAEARAHADAVMERSQATQWFSNVTTTTSPTVRHLASGMTCEFVGQDERDTIRIYNVGDSVPLGDDVSCGTWIGRTYVTVFATRYPASHTEDQAFAAAVEQITRNWPQARRSEREFEILTLEGQSTPLVAVFDVELEGQASRSVLLVRHINGWGFKARATGPGSDDTAIEFGTMQFALSLPGGMETAAAARAADD